MHDGHGGDMLQQQQQQSDMDTRPGNLERYCAMRVDLPPPLITPMLLTTTACHTTTTIARGFSRVWEDDSSVRAKRPQGEHRGVSSSSSAELDGLSRRQQQLHNQQRQCGDGSGLQWTELLQLRGRQDERRRGKLSADGSGKLSARRRTDVECLLPEVLTNIFRYLAVKDRGRAAQVCRRWRDSAYSRSVWRGVTARLHVRRASPSLFPSLVRRGIRKVQVLSLRRPLRDVVSGVSSLTCLNLAGCYSVSDGAVSHAFTAKCLTLRELDLSLCKQVTDPSLGRISQYVKNLEVLKLGGCSGITNTGLLLIAFGLKNLKVVDLRSCRNVSDQGIGYISGTYESSDGGNKSLKSLCLQDCQKLTDAALSHIAEGLPNLESLNLSFCASVTDSGLKHLSKLSTLHNLNVSSCDNLSDAGIAFLLEVDRIKLTRLDVSFCDKMSDQTMIVLSEHCPESLCTLSMCVCRITDDGMARLVHSCRHIETLNVGQCVLLTDRSLELISNHLTGLTSLDLYGCTRLTQAAILSTKSKLKTLNSLNRGLWRCSSHTEGPKPPT